MPQFAGKVVIVTGSSNGIGRETARHFAAEGALVTIHGRNEEALEQAKKEVHEAGGNDVIVVRGDVREDSVQKKLIEETLAKHGKIDILVNNAGGMVELCPRKGFEQSIEDFDYIIGLNLRSVLSLTMLAMPHLIKSQGEVVNVSSIAGLNFGAESVPYYAIAKAGLDQLTRSLGTHYIKQGVRVNSVNPGMVRTTIMKKQGVDSDLQEKDSNIPEGRVGLPSDIAKAIAYLADRNASPFLVGHLLVVDGGSHLNMRLMSTSSKKFAALGKQKQ
ncbi:unnamed protein product [Caenorhabditis auriculariae]|uniref:Uncharacterized protein n=1 Tax=Caenorhabditis auriculariae TaxID=2777116 RepID=A0A8S1HB49_9PELO|nr:unnamed protein product [Caenorhabditis auriculariae]